ncbi:helix-turn-helix domain-containing protein [Miltoncostaea marina]|uniref:helix-turn-helix domain-containing protein n=1 Tax=Miltoncostaea marina TaxID=2843215 RepID=UPI001C3C1D33|nr:helix-turn-helix domain-containing protein [Miltoncostaea marina]
MPQLTGSRPQLLTTKEAADLLRVSQRTITQWIAEDRIPYVRLPAAGERPTFRIPLAGLLRTLTGNFDLASELADLDQRTAAVKLTEEQVMDIFKD